MKISIIAAMAKNKVIGKNNKLPWHLSEDLKNFKILTTGKPIVMGRKTYESIGKPLPQRRNIVLTRNTKLKIDGCEVMSSKDQLLKELQEEKEIMVIGGSEIYQMFLPEATTIHLT
ncbi:MAG: dihydrofolate reductase, partial [Pseudomonadota bacterium]|nr:dihydrofolate reductase [Pseudomonadota bacterium]